MLDVVTTPRQNISADARAQNNRSKMTSSTNRKYITYCITIGEGPTAATGMSLNAVDISHRTLIAACMCLQQRDFTNGLY